MRKLFFIPLLAFFMVQCQQQKAETKKTTDLKISALKPVRATIGAISSSNKNVKVKNFKIQPNESLYLLLRKFDFTPAEIYQTIQKAKNIIDVMSFRSGQPYKAYMAEADSARLQKLVWHPNPVDFVVFSWQSDSLRIYKASKPIKKELGQVEGTITSSLYNAISDDKARDELVYKMTEILAWQIDFFNLRDGDKFKILYEKKYVGDNYFRLGNVKAVKFVHMGDTYNAYKFKHGEFDGYFDQDGNSVQKALLKTPFKYDYRISSHFSHNRLNPVTHKHMPHTGTDYAAPKGTPVRATGDGVVIRAGYAGAAGNMVKIRHNSTYKTAYMHMNRFASGIRKGVHVKQGQVIGYVGSTGRSTGYHLHYSVYKNGTAVNSLTLELPSSRSVPDNLMDEFKKERNRLNKKLKKQKTKLVLKRTPSK